MSNEITAQVENTTLGNWAPAGFDEAIKFSEMVAATEFVPKGYKGRPGDCLMAMMTGNEVGLGPMAALQNIAVINGHPSIWGDAALALVKSSPDYEYLSESFDAERHSAICKAKKRGEPEVIREFSIDDAKRAGLWDKAGPWKTYPKRMLQMRARSWAIRDTWPHVLKGLSISEEAQDIPINVTPGASAKTINEDGQGKKDEVQELRDELKVTLKKAVANKTITQEEMDKTLENSMKYQAKDVLQGFIDKINDALKEANNA